MVAFEKRQQVNEERAARRAANRTNVDEAEHLWVNPSMMPYVSGVYRK